MNLLLDTHAAFWSIVDERRLSSIARAAIEAPGNEVHVTVSHVGEAGLLQSPHRDPFDRLLAAQATIEGLTLVTADARLQALGAPWLW